MLDADSFYVDSVKKMIDNGEVQMVILNLYMIYGPQ